MQSDQLVRRFLATVHPEPFSGCWLWSGTIGGSGYGYISVGGRAGIRARAHRLAYELFVGPIPKGFDLDHLCRVRLCVNPNHLEPVTRSENLLRGEGVGKYQAQKTHCALGHPYSEENTSHSVRDGSPRRRCLACHRNSEAKRRVQCHTAKN